MEKSNKLDQCRANAMLKKNKNHDDDDEKIKSSIDEESHDVLF